MPKISAGSLHQANRVGICPHYGSDVSQQGNIDAKANGRKAHTMRSSAFILTLTEYMDVQKQIDEYVTSIPAPKQQDMVTLHELASHISAGKRLWFFDGKDANDKTVSNPTIGYGLYTIKYANGSTREFFRVGISANSTGISVHIMGIKDKTFLQQTYGKELGKANVTGYCIKFRKLQDINTEVLEAAMQYALDLPSE